jgi:hypothetical protein|tara:strand:+ start:5030 stop:5269 length:240 start_codon:yes stop_codon:yes gene_type:complete
MSKVIEVRRSILKNIELLAQECADVMHYLKVKMIYEHLSEKMGEDCPALSELEGILDDLAKAQNDFRKDGKGYYWAGYP